MNRVRYVPGVLMILVFQLLLITSVAGEVERSVNSKDVLKVGKPLPNATLQQYGGPEIQLSNLKGKIKIISIVPQLNTPVCDKQTHWFSEQNGGLDRHVDIITISTNSPKGQYQFARKAGINNLIFLSDVPAYDFGKQSGLLYEGLGVLKRTVLIVDENNVIRYVDFVPSGGMPDVRKALSVAQNMVDKRGS